MTKTFPTMGLIMWGKRLPVIAVYDNGGKTIDRYTAVISRRFMPANKGFHSCLGFSDGGRAFSQFSECRIGRHLGRKLKPEEITPEISNHLYQCLIEE